MIRHRPARFARRHNPAGRQAMTPGGESVRGGRRGFSLVTVLAALMFLATTAVALTALFAAQTRRTATAADDAQARQLLLAGAQAALERLAAGPVPATFEVPLPPGLSRYRLTVTPVAPGGAAAGREATLRIAVTPAPGADAPSRRWAGATQTIHARAGDAGWVVTAAEMGR